MSDDPKSWLDRISDALTREPQDKQALLGILRDAHARELLDHDALSMMEGVLRVAQLNVSDVMIPRAQMVAIESGHKLKEIIQIITSSGHSRFPVFSEKHDEIQGILFAKDLLGHTKKHAFSAFNLNELIRPAAFIPESQPLNLLLKEFRLKRYHMAIVMDEYANIAGLITIEDVLEQIVGDIEDEYDAIKDEPNIKKMESGHYLAKASTPLEELNDYFATAFSDEEADTLGGLILSSLGHLPQRGENLTLAPFTIKVLHADHRRIHVVQLTLNNQTPDPGSETHGTPEQNKE